MYLSFSGYYDSWNEKEQVNMYINDMEDDNGLLKVITKYFKSKLDESLKDENYDEARDTMRYLEQIKNEYYEAKNTAHERKMQYLADQEKEEQAL